MSRYFCADLHMGDPNVVKYRPRFASLKEHDEFICDVVFSPLRKWDILTVAGDGFISKAALHSLKKFLFKVQLIPGNHCLEKGVTVQDLAEAIDSLQGPMKWKRFWVTHFPCHPDHLRGKMNIHGHLHDVIIPDPRYINVSLETAGYRAIHHDEILSGSYRTFRQPV